MSEERRKHIGMLSENEEKIKDLKYQIKSRIEVIRNLIDPCEKIEEMEVDRAFAEMADLARLWADYKGLLEEIALIKKTLGR